MSDTTPLFTPEEGRRIRRSWSYRKSRVLDRIFGPWARLPLVGVGAMFWYGVLDEGLAALKPRWGMLTFHFLNDGFRPTLWHTWQQVAHPGGPYDGTYLDGAPRNAAEADAVKAAASIAPEWTTSTNSDPQWTYTISGTTAT